MRPDIAFPDVRVEAYERVAPGVVAVTVARRDWPRFWRMRREVLVFRLGADGCTWFWSVAGVPLRLAPAHVWLGLAEAGQ